MQVERKLIQEALDLIGDCEGLSLREDYSGRSMYGKSCFGFVGTLREFSEFLVTLAQLEHEEDPYAESIAMGLAQSVCTDNMGLSTIFYFPGYHLEEE
jgi:hypothetical protein